MEVVWSPPPLDDAACTDHYQLLGIAPALGAGATSMQRVLHLGAVDCETVKDCYKKTLQHFAGNPFRLSKLNQAFSVLTHEQKRKVYDLELMQKAALAATCTVLYCVLGIQYNGSLLQ